MSKVPYQRLVVKYRPQALEDTGMDSHAITILNTMLRNDSIRVMLVGDSGSGKTAIIHVLEKLYYGDNVPAGAVMHMSAHGEKTITHQRAELKTFCRSQGPWKRMVVMDDAEQLAPALQQTLKHCVDTYGRNVMFICACTQVQRVARSLRARLITIQTRHLSDASLRLLLERVCDVEHIVLDPDAKQHLISASGVSARTLLQNLEKLRLHGGHVTLDLAQRCCSTVHPKALMGFTEACNDDDDGGYNAAQMLYGLYDNGHSVMDLLDAYFAYVKITPFPDCKRYPMLRLIAQSIQSFYNEHDDVIILAVFAKRMNALLRSGTSDKEVLTECGIPRHNLGYRLAHEPTVSGSPA